ncbi:MAG: hypothetical protein LBT43_01360 [Prevotella sp.]|jgi:hypothetical protein|nr:hypothetical protein [Prevotella sp.]
MKTNFKYQWDIFFDYLGVFDNSFSGKLMVNIPVNELYEGSESSVGKTIDGI